MPARKISAKPLVSRGIKLLAEERKLTVWPSSLIEGAMLSPFAAGGEFPPPRLARIVLGAQATVVLDSAAQVLRTNAFSTPFTVLAARFDDFEANATRRLLVFWDGVLTLGCSLGAFPGVAPSSVEIRKGGNAELHVAATVPLHVSRT